MKRKVAERFLSLAMTVVLVVGLVPQAALAEVINEGLGSDIKVGLGDDEQIVAAAEANDSVMDYILTM